MQVFFPVPLCVLHVLRQTQGKVLSDGNDDKLVLHTGEDMLIVKSGGGHLHARMIVTYRKKADAIGRKLKKLGTNKNISKIRTV